ncbi:MAG: cyclodeaminase/cyclohydrolase family protein [Chloroflexi bacterium]|nr:cyclodeaminase/cyclohydrolase family protein [Chloroflexota bacterium]
MKDSTISQFLDQLASGSPTPGGGSVAALSGALAAALISMVCNLTLGREQYKGVEKEIGQLLAGSEGWRKRLTELIEEDIRAYQGLVASYKLPKSSPQETEARTRAIQEALMQATRVPLSIAQGCAELMQLCQPAVKMGNVNAVSDVGVGVLLAEAGLRSSLLNVDINLPRVKDEDFRISCEKQVAELRQGKDELRRKILSQVEGKLAG